MEGISKFLGGAGDFLTKSPVGSGLMVLFGLLTIPRLIGGLFGGSEEGEGKDGPGIFGWIMGALGAAALFMGGKNLMDMFGGDKTGYKDEIDAITQKGYENNNTAGANTGVDAAEYTAAAKSILNALEAETDEKLRFQTVENILKGYAAEGATLDATDATLDAAMDIAGQLRNNAPEAIKENLSIA